MASSWKIRSRNMRSKPSWRSTQRPPEDCFRLDTIKSTVENTYDIYLLLCSRSTADTKRLSALNALVKILCDEPKESNLGFTCEEFLYCISPSLVHALTQVRAGALRAVRHLIRTQKDMSVFNLLQLPYLVCRSLDVLLRNEEERVQSLKLIRKMLAISPNSISFVLVRCLVALGDSGVDDGDRMLRACLATLCEFGVLNPSLLIFCGGVSAITRNVLECHSPRIAESLCGVLLHLLEWPHTRSIAGVRLECLAAPYCDFTYRLGIMDKNKDARDLRFTCSRLALLSVLRSWAGTIEFCDPNKPSGLKAIVDVLYLNQREVRRAILDLMYELLGLPQPVWTDEYSVALAAVDPSDFQDSWRLSEGFVATEGRSVLPSLANRVPNICEIHMALLLYCFLETGLLNALIEVIVSSDTFISVRATVLLGKLLQLMHILLPADICNTSPSLPGLVQQAAKGNNQARAAIAALQSYHQMLKNRPASCSLFLDNIIQSGVTINSKLFKREIVTQENLPTLPLKRSTGTLERTRHDSVGSSSTNNDDFPMLHMPKRSSIRRGKLLSFFDGIKESEKLFRESNVLLNKDGNAWDWDIIIAILKSNALGKMDDNQIKFIRRLIHFYKPSSNRFSHQDLGHTRHIPSFVVAGLELIDWLLNITDLESTRFLTDLFTDINTHLQAISTSRSAHDCLFSPQHMSSTMCQQYFLFIGRMCRNEKGLKILSNTDVFKQLQNLVKTTIHVCYIKLIVSSLVYTIDGLPRRILEHALQLSELRTGRLYATQFLLVLLRAKVPNFEVWGLPLLIKQTNDKEKSVVLAALEILDEACHERIYLEEIVNVWPNLEKLHDQGKLLMTRFYSISRGLNHPDARIENTIESWIKKYNKRYVLLVEADTHANLTLHIKSEDGVYNRRTCSTRPTSVPPNILPHLYGQLVQTTQGMENLLRYGDVHRQIEIISLANCADEAESLQLKSAMWALGHVSTSAEGVQFLNDLVSRVYEKLIALAKHCDVYSIRATALAVLGLVGSTSAGANALYKLDWFCVRHDRNTIWPVCEPEDWLSKHLSPMRHQYGEMAPYNYRGIDEDINGTMVSSETDGVASNSFYFEDAAKEPTVGVDDYSNDDQSRNAVRSRTLPESTNTKLIKHSRSLSESKTVDKGISLMAVNNRTRFNSGTDSNTSGVSSCESVYGRNVMNDLQQTLSPIPSSSNLLETGKGTERRIRRISLTGIPHREPSLSPQDLQGYATLRSIRRHWRPMFSESAVDELAEIIDHIIDDRGLRIKKSSSIVDNQRKLKVRSLDRQFILISTSSGEIPIQTNPDYPSKFLVKNDTRGPCYAGICLPKNILDLFPKRNINTTYVSTNLQDLYNENGLQDFIKNQLVSDNVPDGDESSISSLSDISVTSKRSKLAGKHLRSTCLSCCRSKTRLYPRSDSDSICRRKSYQNSLLRLSDISFNSPESVFSDDTSMPDRVTTTILRHVQRMANPIWSKHSKTTLLELKQKHPLSFQDICLYSEVCKSLGRNTYRLNARRFLQELFLDLDFDSFYIEANDIIARKDRDRSDQHAIASGDEEILIVSNKRTDGNEIGSGNNLISSNIHLKVQLKSPPILDSVYETSIENLAGSLGSKASRMLLSHTPNDSGTVESDVTDKPVSFMNTDYGINMRYTNRPRFNTLELDLSCTKNKFPITDRRKTDFSPTLSCREWSVQEFKNLSSSVQSTGMDAVSSATTREARTGTETGTGNVGSLYCEKRLQTSKSEATLSKSSN